MGHQNVFVNKFDMFLGTDRVFPRVYSLRSEQIEFQSTFLAAFFFASLSQKESFIPLQKGWERPESQKKHSTFILFCDKTNKLAGKSWRMLKRTKREKSGREKRDNIRGNPIASKRKRKPYGGRHVLSLLFMAKSNGLPVTVP